jgi:hypothetical protein
MKVPSVTYLPVRSASRTIFRAVDLASSAPLGVAVIAVFESVKYFDK